MSYAWVGPPTEYNGTTPLGGDSGKINLDSHINHSTSKTETI